MIRVPVVDISEKQLPAEILERADYRSSEFAWRPSDIPAVVEAARAANLLNLGGDLQIRAPSGKWGEPIGVSVDTDSVTDDLSWAVRVDETAKVALANFEALQKECDFEAIAREAFPTLLEEVDDPNEVIFFGWQVLSESEETSLNQNWS